MSMAWTNPKNVSKNTDFLDLSPVPARCLSAVELGKQAHLYPSAPQRLCWWRFALLSSSILGGSSGRSLYGLSGLRDIRRPQYRRRQESRLGRGHAPESAPSSTDAVESGTGRRDSFFSR